MADYTAFDRGIVPWLQKVWTDRQVIQQGVRTRGRNEGAWLIYDCRPGKGLWRIYAHVKEPREYNWTPTAVYCLP